MTLPPAGGVSVKEKVPSAFTVAAGSALPFGDSTSVRVTATVVPAGSPSVFVTLPETVSDLARLTVAGAFTVMPVTALPGSVTTRRR